jgi:hypothetical protein
MRLLVLFAVCFAGVQAEIRLGAPLTLKAPTPIGKVLSQGEELNGKLVQVKGKITEVCEMMGCWMNLVDPATDSRIRIKVNDGDIVFPKDKLGRMAIAEGTLRKVVQSKEQAIAAARHEAEEQGRKFDPASVTSGRTYFQIQGLGAVVVD